MIKKIISNTIVILVLAVIIGILTGLFIPKAGMKRRVGPQADKRAGYLFSRSYDNHRFVAPSIRIPERKCFTADSFCLPVSIPFVRRRQHFLPCW